MWPQNSRERARRAWSALAQAASIASFLWIAVPAVVALAAIPVGFLSGHFWIGAFASGAATMLLLLIVLLMYPFHQPLRRIFYGFRITDLQVTIEIDAHGVRCHRRRIQFATRIVRTGIRHLPDRYCCPGPRAGDDVPLRHRPRVVTGNARILGPVYEQSDDCWIYQMDLGAPLSAGTDRTVQLTQELDFTPVNYEPRVQRTILDPTDHLTLCLKVPSNCWPVEASGEEVLPTGGLRAVPVVEDAEHNEVRLDVRRPHFGSIYRIRWSPVNEAWRTQQAPSGQYEVPADIRPKNSSASSLPISHLTQSHPD